jgi:hypothetical protein
VALPSDRRSRLVQDELVQLGDEREPFAHRAGVIERVVLHDPAESSPVWRAIVDESSGLIMNPDPTRGPLDPWTCTMAAACETRAPSRRNATGW